MTLEEEIRRAQRAKQIVNDEIFQSAVEALREGLLLGIRQSAFKDEKLREILCHRYSLLEDFVGLIQSVMETGELAAEEIRRKTLLEEAKQRAKEFFNV